LRNQHIGQYADRHLRSQTSRRKPRQQPVRIRGRGARKTGAHGLSVSRDGPPSGCLSK
jgi:hypothetical protein